MERQAIYLRVTELLSQLFDIDPARITPSSRFEELDLTSLDAIDLVVELQRMTGRKVSEAKMRAVRTVDDIVTLVQEHLAQSGQ
jgi:acyl carrier protein